MMITFKVHTPRPRLMCEDTAHKNEYTKYNISSLNLVDKLIACTCVWCVCVCVLARARVCECVCGLMDPKFGRNNKLFVYVHFETLRTALKLADQHNINMLILSRYILLSPCNF
jgi:hypothetical protein